MLSKLLLGLALACCPLPGKADPYFTARSYSPYPPACVTLLPRQFELYGDNLVSFWSGKLWLELVHKLQSENPISNRGPVDVNMYRLGCAEPNRSVILVEFRLPPDTNTAQLVLPSVYGDGTAMHVVPFELKAEPNGWEQSIEQNALTRRGIGDYTGGWDDAHRFTWLYVLDIGPAGRYWDTDFLTEYYNGSFPLFIQPENGPAARVEVPATRDVLAPNPVLPLNGRLTGTWVEQGAADQGVLLSFSNPVPPASQETAEPENSELSVFLSWFTYDAEGRQLWLAGNARFPQGTVEVTMPLVQVVNGQFLGPRTTSAAGAAARITAGEAQLQARSCNALDVEYDFASPELGSGSMRLQRLFALETAGYPCRDYPARLTSLSPQAGD